MAAPKALGLKRILVANRGEIACRVMRTAKRMGLETVAIHSEADALSRHVRMADQAVQVGYGNAASTSYLDVDAVLGCMASSGADCVHPGYGFLSENAEFARAVAAAGHAFVGPPAAAIDDMGDKLRSKEIATAAGVSVIPGGAEAVADASAGGGGKGMRVAFDAKDVEEQWPLAKDEAVRSFGDDRMLVEKFVQSPRHLEIQVVADAFGNVATFPERECSVQRRNQKVREAAMLARSVGYESAGTVEMLVDGATGAFYFLEMNTRLQVEHPITEAVSGEDLVELMLLVADGQRLPDRLLGAGADPCFVPIDGWAVEARVYAEDASKNFLPDVGVLTAYGDPPGASHFDFGAGWTATGKAASVRIDSGIEDGAEISIYYDPMISKLVATGKDREDALANARAALDGYVVEGLAHNVPFCRDICGNATFLSGTYTTKFIEEEYAAGFDEARVFAGVAGCGPSSTPSSPTTPRPARRSACSTSTRRPRRDSTTRSRRGVRVDAAVSSPNEAELAKFALPPPKPDSLSGLKCPMPGTLLSYAVDEGETVEAGRPLAIVEAMKMQNILRAEHKVVVDKLLSDVGDVVAADQMLIAFVQDDERVAYLYRVGLVFGRFSEASKDVSSLLADVATALSESRWISMGCACPDQAKALLSNELHREWGTTAAKYRARYLISGLKFVDGTWTSKARALSHRLEDDARRLADRAALATLTTNLRCDG
ncbi:CoA carboxylase [Aureococcus anophagefferens]|nr:CoA carboxylase [Aureococcus anophagefferens]